MNYPLYNSTLCPDLWDKKGELYVMRKEVRERLMKIADDFVVEYLAEAKVKIKVKDVVVIGSIANFNWNKFSDIDLHLVFDYADLDMSEEDAFTMLTAIKINWNKSHDIKIKGHDLELGVQGLEQENHSKSTYSVKRNKWLVPPTNVSPKFDKETIKAKHNMMKEKIDALLKAKDDDGLRRILEKLYVMRQAGLDKSGEYSAENIVFKILRAQGYLDKIKDHAAQIYDKEMTLNESLIDDGISSSDGKELVWDYDSNEGVYSLVPTDDDHQRRSFSVYGIPVWAAYRVMPKAVRNMRHDGDEETELMSRELVNIRTAVKHPDHSGKTVVSKLVDTSIKRFLKDPDVEASRFNIIIPLGSKSKLNREVADKLEKKLPNAIILPHFLEKTTWKDVKFSDKFWDTIKRRKAAGMDISWYTGFQKHIEAKKKAHANEPFAIKNVPATTRMYFSMFYRTRENYPVDVEKLMNGANVLLIDDTLEAGATLVEVTRELWKYKVNSLMAYIFLYGKDVTIPAEVPVKE